MERRAQTQTWLLLTLVLSWTQTQASLRVSPDSSQFLRWDSVVLDCEDPDLTLRRTTARETGTRCGQLWGEPDRAKCRFRYIDPMDSGWYWCESREGRSYGGLNISVIDRGVVLQVPVLPVTEGQTVSLSCRHHTSSNLTARFHRDGHFLWEEPTGHMTLQQVSASDEGLYQCEIRGETSESSWIRVRPGEPQSPPPTTEALPPSTEAPPPASERPLALALLCHLVVLCPYVVSTVLMVSLYRGTLSGNQEQPVTAVMTSPVHDATGLDEETDDITAITTEHNF